MNFQMNSFSNYFKQGMSRSWITLVKIGLGFLVVGTLILLLKEFIIAILSALFFLIGFLILIAAYKAWRLNHFHSNKIY